MSCHSPTHLSCLLGQVFCPCNCLPTVLLRCKEVRPPHQASGAPGLSRKPPTGLKETFTYRQQKEITIVQGQQYIGNPITNFEEGGFPEYLLK